ncbi:MAG: type II toxin-antitoxin system prevent-host-death family antitoxin [Gemmatimonadetes bacterium]|nr:type II toxin-antitoxin system prevent-host-death family antitoxin [Gemmatimonadota bacterium]
MISFGRAEPVAVAKRGRPVVVVMAVEEFERLNRIVAAKHRHIRLEHGSLGGKIQ